MYGKGKRDLKSTKISPVRMLVLAVLLGLLPARLLAECTDTKIALRGGWGSVSFETTVVDTVESRARGLMFVKNLPRFSSMLFVYEKPQPVSFWMKNTLIPLDMIFIDNQGRVQLVHENAVPGDLSPINGGTDILAVLEFNGGLSQQLGLNAGSQVQHPAFSENSPVWSCD